MQKPQGTLWLLPYRKRRKMPLNPHVKKLLRIGLLLMFLFSTAMSVRTLSVSRKGAQVYEAAYALAASPTQAPEETTQPDIPGETIAVLKYRAPEPVEEDAGLEEIKKINLAALQEVNPDVVGWVLIPGTKVNYPIVQGTDNEHYLKVTWDGKPYAMGSIVLECTNTPDMTQFHTILYGHNMNDGSMFASLRSYSQEKYWKEHPYIYVASSEGCFRYEVFSSYQARVDSSTYALEFDPDWGPEYFIATILEKSKINTGIVPEPTDRILTLSTCAGGYTTRWVVHARLKMVLLEKGVG